MVFAWTFGNCGGRDVRIAAYCMSLPELVDEVFHRRSRSCFVTCTGSVLPFQLLNTRFASGVHVFTGALFKSTSSYVSAAAAVHDKEGKRPSVLMLCDRRID